ncbi:MAG: universal stress protein [Candidatus Hydrogenedentales bacterium]|jgi:nucleotide-binding universal stress UspA family protein
MPPLPDFGKILVYIETNEHGLQAIRYAVAFAKRFGGELHAIAIINERLLEELTRAHVFLKEEEVALKMDLEDDGRRHLALMERFAQEKELEVTTELLHGVVHRQVLDKAREISANLIILGEIEESLSRKDTTFNESERIIYGARCPVLVVRGRQVIKDFFNSV